MHSVYRPFFHLVIPSVESVYLSVHPSNCSVHFSIHSVRPSICLFIHLSLHLSSQSIHSVHPTMLSARIFMSVYLSISLSIRSVPIHLSVCPSGNITVCPICLLVPPSVHLSIHPYYTSIQSVWSSICSVCPSVHSDSAHQFICHFKGHFDPTDRNDRTSESIINKHSCQTDYPSVRSTSIHSVHPYIRPARNSICLSIYLFSPFVHRMDGRTSFSFSERKLCFGSCDLMY